jgi:hypothetical protein
MDSAVNLGNGSISSRKSIRSFIGIESIPLSLYIYNLFMKTVRKLELVERGKPNSLPLSPTLAYPLDVDHVVV